MHKGKAREFVGKVTKAALSRNLYVDACAGQLKQCSTYGQLDDMQTAASSQQPIEETCKVLLQIDSKLAFKGRC